MHEKFRPFLAIFSNNFANERRRKDVGREVVQRPVELFREAQFDGRVDLYR